MNSNKIPFSRYSTPGSGHSLPVCEPLPVAGPPSAGPVSASLPFHTAPSGVVVWLRLDPAVIGKSWRRGPLFVPKMHNHHHSLKITSKGCHIFTLDS